MPCAKYIMSEQILQAMKVHPFQGTGFASNIYYVENGGERLLVDAGWDADISHIAKGLDNLLGGRKLDALVLTHRHIDHVGGAAAVLKKYGCKALTHEKDSKALEEGDEVTTGAALFGSSFKPLPVEPVNEGEKIAGMDVIHTPGHTIGSFCLYDPDSRALFSGDTVFCEGVGRWDLPTGDLKALVESIRRLSKLEVDGLYPGHGRAVEEMGGAFIEQDLRYIAEWGDG